VAQDKLDGLKWNYSSFESLVVQAQTLINREDELSTEIIRRIENADAKMINQINLHSSNIVDRYGLKFGATSILWGYLANTETFPNCPIDKTVIKKLMIDDMQIQLQHANFVEILDAVVTYLFPYEKDPTRMMLPLVLFVEYYENNNKNMPEILYTALVNAGADEKYFLTHNKELIIKVLGGKRALEIGGFDMKAQFSEYGIDVMEPIIEQHSFTRVNEEGRVTLDSYKTQIGTRQADIGFSRELLSHGSGIQYGDHGLDWSCREMMTVYANLTKNGGLNLHIGDSVPGGDFLDLIGFKQLHKWSPDSGWGFDHFFLMKTNNKITTKEEFLAIAGNK